MSGHLGFIMRSIERTIGFKLLESGIDAINMFKFGHDFVFDIKILCKGVALFGVWLVETIPDDWSVFIDFIDLLGVCFLLVLSLLKFYFAVFKSLLNLSHVGFVVQFGKIIELLVLPHGWMNNLLI